MLTSQIVIILTVMMVMMTTMLLSLAMTKEFSCTDVEKENCRPIDKHHIGDIFFSLFQIVTFVENSTALPMLLSLWGKQ